MNSNMELYEKVRSVPTEALKPIQGGRLKGMSDINPMWRIKILTELFGICGIGWKIEVVERRLEKGALDEVACFVDINLYIKSDGEWSEAIPGMGGSSFVAKEKSGLYTSDECFKMAYTDAIGVACKSLGFAADVYFEKDRTKYSDNGYSDKSEDNKAKEEEKFLSDCKLKWQTLAGNMDGFQEWHDKKIAEGTTNKQLNAALAQRLLAKTKESA